jgi:hypothetical protein
MNTLLTDSELINAFSRSNGGKREWYAYFTPVSEPRLVAYADLWDIKPFTADNKKEAVRIAREYGARIIGKKLDYVYLKPKGR